MLRAVACYEATLGGEHAAGRLQGRRRHHDHHGGPARRHDHDHHGALIDVAAHDRRHRLGPSAPRLPRRSRVGVVVLMGSVYLLLGTNLGTRLGFLRRHQRLLRLAARSWASPGGCTARSACSARPRSGWSRRSSTTATPPTTPACSEADLEYAQRPRHLGAPARGGDQRPRPRRARRTSRRRSSPRSAAGRSCPSRTRASARPRPPSTSTSPRTPTRSLDTSRGPASYVNVYSFERGGKIDLPEDPTRLERIGHKLETDLLAGASTRRATPSSRCARSIEQETEPGRGAADPRGRPGPAGGVGDHRARPRRRAVPGRHAHDLRRADVRRDDQHAAPP